MSFKGFIKTNYLFTLIFYQLFQVSLLLVQATFKCTG